MLSTTANAENPMNEEEAPDFEPTIGLAIADTWWALGRRLHAFHPDEPADHRRAAAVEWIEYLFKDGEKEDWYDDALVALTPAQLQTFAEDLHALLERKFRGEPIGKDVLERIRPSAGFTIDESEQFIELRESVDVWWANEYREVFLEMEKREKSPSWTFAGAYCANERCKRFFIKRRPNQQYHSEACQARSANQRSYRKHRSTAHRRMVTS